MPRKIKWTFELLKKEALKHNNRSSLYRNGRGAYGAALRNKCLDEICQHMSPYFVSWTKELCAEEASKYTTRTAFSKKGTNAYYASLRNGWLDEICPHMPTPNNWTLEACSKEALKYNNKAAFKKNNGSAYCAAREKKWLNNICNHMDILWKKKWTIDNCKKAALQFNTRHEFEKGNRKAYGAAVVHKWLDEVCKHMNLPNNTSSSEKELFIKIKTLFTKTQKLVDRKVVIPNKPHIKGFDIDIYIPELRKGIEFDGRYWHDRAGLRRGRPTWPQEDLENYHQIKDEYFKSKGIELLHIKEDDWMKDRESCLKKCMEFLNV